MTEKLDCLHQPTFYVVRGEILSTRHSDLVINNCSLSHVSQIMGVIMQDLSRGGGGDIFFIEGATCGMWTTMRLIGGSGACYPENIFQNGAFRSIYFDNSLT